MATTIEIQQRAGRSGGARGEAPAAATPPARWSIGTWWLAAVVVVVGLGFGALTEFLQGVLDDPWAAWVNSIAAWCLPAFLVGALAVDHLRAMVAGVLTLLLLLVGYYGVNVAQGVATNPGTVLVWTGAAIVAGIVFGLAGAWWRSDGRVVQTLGAALISAVLVGEGVQRAVLFPWQGNAGVIMIGAGLLLGIALGRIPVQRVLVPALAVLAVPLAFGGAWATNLALAYWQVP